MCVDVNRSYGSEDVLRHNLIDLNTGTTWTPDEDEDMDGMATVVPRHNLNVKNVTQIEKDSILVCYESEWPPICQIDFFSLAVHKIWAWSYVLFSLQIIFCRFIFSNSFFLLQI